jgi:hypothetical protein
MVILGLSASENVRKIGRSEILPEIVEDILIVRDYAFVVNMARGLAILKIEEPADSETTIRTGSFDTGQ